MAAYYFTYLILENNEGYVAIFVGTGYALVAASIVMGSMITVGRMIREFGVCTLIG